MSDNFWLQSDWDLIFFLGFFFFLSFFLIQAVFIGMMISSSLWGNISDKYGRKTVSSNSIQSEVQMIYRVRVS